MWFYKKGVNKIEGSPFSPIINEILTKRGVEPSEFERFVFNTEAYKHDPLEMKGVKELVERLIKTMEKRFLIIRTQIVMEFVLEHYFLNL